MKTISFRTDYQKNGENVMVLKKGVKEIRFNPETREIAIVVVEKRKPKK